MKYNPRIVLPYYSQRGLPIPETEYRFCDARKWRFDFAWPESRIALEVEGGVWTGGRHTRGSGFIKDMEKYNIAAMLGWRVLRVQPKDLCMKSTVDLIVKTLTTAPTAQHVNT